MNYYTGIGSRRTPEDICDLMTKTARYLYFKGYTLRSGGAIGADSAFEIGAGEKKEIFLPWKGFNDNTSELYNIPEEAYKIAAKFHPVWDNLKDYVKQVHARNSCQVLGKDLKTPSDFVICWTPKAKMKGGTAQAIRIAIAYDIPVFNLANEEDKKRILSKLNS